MANTYTSTFEFVNNGGSTVENPETLTAENNINILNSEIQWEGSETTDSSTSYSTNTNSGSATATTSTTYNTTTNSGDNFDSTINGSTLNTSVGVSSPSFSGTADDYYIEMNARGYDDGTNGTLQATYDTDGGGSGSTDIAADDTWRTVYSALGAGTPDSSYGLVADYIPNGQTAQIDVEIIIEQGYDTTSTNNDTATVSYPSVPSGYNFDRHYWREEKNGSYVDSGYINSNSVGSSRSVTSTSTNDTWTLEMRTRGSSTSTGTNYTQNPSVSGDVSASYNGTLGNNETSTWQTLTGFTNGDNTFNHSISDSGEGYYRIRFDWEFALPTAVSIERFSIGSTDYDITLADPTDNALDYNFFRTHVDGDGILAYDVVDPSDSSALDYYVYHPTYGKLALREKK